MICSIALTFVEYRQTEPLTSRYAARAASGAFPKKRIGLKISVTGPRALMGRHTFEARRAVVAGAAGEYERGSDHQDPVHHAHVGNGARYCICAASWSTCRHFPKSSSLGA